MKTNPDDNILNAETLQKFANYAKREGISRINGCPNWWVQDDVAKYVQVSRLNGRLNRATVSIPGFTLDGSLTWGQALDILWKEFGVGKTLVDRELGRY